MFTLECYIGNHQVIKLNARGALSSRMSMISPGTLNTFKNEATVEEIEPLARCYFLIMFVI
jgi:hypothetical protein